MWCGEDSLVCARVDHIVKVTRRGQTTIPSKFRRRHRIRQASHLVVIDRGNEIVMRPVPDLEDLAGSLSKFATAKEVNALVDEAAPDKE